LSKSFLRRAKNVIDRLTLQIFGKSNRRFSLNKLTREPALLAGIWLDRAADKNQIRDLLSTLIPVHNSRGLVRFGPLADGGYLIPDDLEGMCACVSPGVAHECGFELAMASRGIDVYMADGSVDGPPMDHSRFHFCKKLLGTVNSDTSITIDEFCQISVPTASSDLILQMDIEGAEYSVIHSMSEDLLRRFRIMVVEYHDLDQIFSRFGFRILKNTFVKMQSYHEIVHIHPNNCGGTVQFGELKIPKIAEFTYYRRDRAVFDKNTTLIFPHPLDVDNIPTETHITLPACLRNIF
jgi:hypothetical protein